MRQILKLIASLRPNFKRHRKADRFAAEREVVWKAYQAATRRGDTRGIAAASASMQALTHAQLRAELGL